MRIGLIADTHGLIRPTALSALGGVELIVHAGDIGRPQVLDALREIAPVLAVRGNNDVGAWAANLPTSITHKIGEFQLHVIHALSELVLDPVCERISILVHGHSHRPEHRLMNGVHYVNPGSAGPRRFKLPVTMALLALKVHAISVDIVPLG